MISERYIKILNPDRETIIFLIAGKTIVILALN
jgi:hypothetical protein